MVWICMKSNLVLSHSFFLEGGGGRLVSNIKVAQNGLKHIVVLEFLIPMKFSKLHKWPQASNLTTNQLTLRTKT